VRYERVIGIPPGGFPGAPSVSAAAIRVMHARPFGFPVPELDFCG